MRSSGMAVAVVGACCLLAPATAAGQPLVKGTIEGGGKAPVQGAVTLEAWPVGPTPKRDVKNPVVARSTTDAAGRFTLSAEVTRKLRRLALLNDQRRIDFRVRGAGAGLMGEYTFTRFLSRAGTLVPPGAPQRASATAASVGGSPVTVRLREPVGMSPRAASTSTPARSARLLDECVSNDRVVDTQPAATVVGELNNAYRDTKAYWGYGQGGESSFNIATLVEGEDISYGGGVTVKNSTDSEISLGPVGVYSRRQYSEFLYEKWKRTIGCSGGTKFEIRAKKWLGDGTSRKQRGAIRVCERGERVKNSIHEGQRGFRRASRSATEWEGGANVYGAGLTVKSGYSQQIRAKWKFGGPRKRLHYLCGDDGPPTESGRIFSGLKRRG